MSIDLDELEAEARGQGLLNGGIILGLIVRLRAAEGIVRDLAALHIESTDMGARCCGICGAPDSYGHMPKCLILRAKELDTAD